MLAPRARLSRVVLAASLVATAAGCSTTSPSLNTASLPPRPQHGMDHPSPPPREYRDTAQYEYRPRQVARAYGHDDRRITTGSLGDRRPAPAGYDDRSRWNASPRAAYAPPAEHRDPRHGRLIEVREGDTLYGISRRYRIPVADLIRTNHLPEERIEVGQRLWIPRTPHY